MIDYRYKLASNRFPKLTCPHCKAKRHWQRYVDTKKNEVLPEQYGVCDNTVKCGEALNPYKDGYAKMIFEQENGNSSKTWKAKKPVQRKKTVPKLAFIPNDILNSTLLGYEQNTFIQNLLQRIDFPFEAADVQQVIEQYYLGTICNGYMANSITFPFIDEKENIRAIQVKQFDETNHTMNTNFIHSIIENNCIKKAEPLPEWLQAYKNNELKVSCLFGEHLLNKYPMNPIALVEAPKTAIYGTLYFGLPETNTNLLWLAVYNLSSLTFDKCKVLNGRNVFLFPDLSADGKAFELWSKKAHEFSETIPKARFKVSDLLETYAPTELKNDAGDIADVLIKMNWRNFRAQPAEVMVQQVSEPNNEPEPIPKSVKSVNSEGVNKTIFQTENKRSFVQPSFIKPVTEDWGQQISELENFFNEVELPAEPIRLNQCSEVLNVSQFVETHLATLKNYNGNSNFLPFLNRLKLIKQQFNNYENG